MALIAADFLLKFNANMKPVDSDGKAVIMSCWNINSFCNWWYFS